MIARELTKIHETFYRNSINEIGNFKLPLKGELTVVISKKNTKHILITNDEIKKEVFKYLRKYSVKDVVELISKKERLSKKKVYQICLEVKKNENKI